MSSLGILTSKASPRASGSVPVAALRRAPPSSSIHYPLPSPAESSPEERKLQLFPGKFGSFFRGIALSRRKRIWVVEKPPRLRPNLVARNPRIQPRPKCPWRSRRWLCTPARPAASARRRTRSTPTCRATSNSTPGRRRPQPRRRLLRVRSRSSAASRASSLRRRRLWLSTRRRRRASLGAEEMNWRGKREVRNLGS